MQPTLLVIQGPTGVGKTDVTLALANRLNTPILNADSRQIYRDLPIGTAAPTAEQLQQAQHYFVGIKSLDETFSAGDFEREALALLDTLFVRHDVVILSGGSMMYVDAVCKGFDDLPSIDADIRERVRAELLSHSLRHLQQWLLRLDPDYYDVVDLQNTQRVSHAIEMCLQTGKPYSSLRTGRAKQRPFGILKVGLDMPREQLYDRINRRVDLMIAQGLLAEAERVLEPYHNEPLPNSLNTVGYKELFKVKTGEWTEDFAISMIKQNSRRYAKRQLTWLRHDKDIHWLNINDYETTQDITLAICNMLSSMS